MLLKQMSLVVIALKTLTAMVLSEAERHFHVGCFFFSLVGLLIY